ncbi:pilus assembly PilX family protein [Zooshikella ganghwensis]|uniref:pilus assembly PilX family protein n=1 Tax=Zooshikella ganghwensis TaxID=202772 RepID=UPI0009FD0738|nr:PilX N-terminal domain-containing pilus assembly protein [Zooshikella ganghwensis]
MNRLIRNEKGVSLLYCLIIMLALSVVGIGMTSSLNTTTKITTNQRDKQIALEAAEAALRYAEEWLSSSNESPTLSTIDTAYEKDKIIVWPQINDKSVWKSDDHWENTYSLENGFYNYGEGRNIQPQFAIEFLARQGDTVETSDENQAIKRAYYRITSRGLGPGNSEVILQSVVMKRF